jgi:hypothetical protein
MVRRKARAVLAHWRAACLVTVALSAGLSTAVNLYKGAQERNAIGCSQNQQNAILRGMIVEGAVNSKPFEDIYISHGQPPYAVRVENAKKIAARLAPLPCK